MSIYKNSLSHQTEIVFYSRNQKLSCYNLIKNDGLMCFDHNFDYSVSQNILDHMIFRI